MCQESLLTVLFHSTTLRKCRKPTCAPTRILLGFAHIEMVSDSLPEPREAESRERPRSFRYSRLHTRSVLCFIDRRCGLKTVIGALLFQMPLGLQLRDAPHTGPRPFPHGN